MDDGTPLKVPFTEKDKAKAAGARWNPAERIWYVPAGLDPTPFAQWLENPPAPVQSELLDGSIEQARGTSLTEYLLRIKAAVERPFQSAEWVRVEISELRENNGNIYLNLIEHAPGGRLAARISGMIWSSERNIVEHFCEATGTSLAAGLKLLICVRPKLDPRYGLSLIISGIDPAYTLGDMAEKIRRITKALRDAGLYDRQKALPPPHELTHVIVVSPRSAAGLGDFRREADLLEAHGLCRFTYLDAVFQGDNASASVSKALEVAADLAQGADPADAIALIRGGGAVSDLHWLNDEAIARTICKCPLPVLTGIGHERDNTVLDDVAFTRFDTPSKVSGFLFRRITEFAQRGASDMEAIIAAANRRVDQAEHQADQLHRVTVTSSTAQLDQAEIRAQHMLDSVRSGASVTLQHAEQQATQLHSAIGERASALLDRADALAVQAWREVVQHASARLDAAATAATQVWNTTKERAAGHVDRAARDARALMQEILGMGPGPTVARGFGILRDPQGRVVSTIADAAGHDALELELRDGRITLHTTQEKGK